MDKEQINKEVKKAMEQVEKAMSQVKLAEKQAKQARREAKQRGKNPGTHIYTEQPPADGGYNGGATYVQDNVTNVQGTYIHISHAKNVQVGNNNTMIIKKSSKKNKSGGRDDLNDEVDEPEEDDSAARAEQAELEKLPIFSSKRRLKDEEIDLLCTRVSNWRRFLRFLDLEESNIEHVYEEHFHAGGVKQVLYQGIKMWQRKEAKSASINIVARALLKTECADVIKELQP